MSRSSVSADDRGFVTALFDNGIEKKVFKIPVATFANPDALAATTGNAYLVTDNSGVLTDAGASTDAKAAILERLLAGASPSPRSMRASPEYRLAMLRVLAVRALDLGHRRLVAGESACPNCTR